MNLTDLSVRGFIDEVAASSPAPGGGSVSALAAALAAALVSMVGSLTLRKLACGGTGQAPTRATTSAPHGTPASGLTCTSASAPGLAPGSAPGSAEGGMAAQVDTERGAQRSDAGMQGQMAGTGVRSPDTGAQRDGARTQQPDPDIEADMTMAVDIANDLRRHFERLVDEDAAAFNAVMAAYRLPKSTDEEKKARSAAIQAALKEACRAPSEVAKGAVEVLRLSDLAVREGVQSALSDAAVACLAADAALHGAYLNVMINLGSIKDQTFVTVMREEMSKALESGETIRERVMARVRKALG